MSTPRILLYRATVAAISFTTPFVLHAQMPVDPNQAPAALHAANLPSMPIGCDDLLQISVYDSPELTGSIRVNAQGAIFLPILKTPIAASGLYPKELEAKIAESLSAGQLIVNPFVTVTVLEYQSRPVTVTGAVRHPVSFQAYGTVFLIDAIVRADGLAPDAGEQVLVTARPAAGEAPMVRRIPLKELMSGKSPELNLQLHGGEEIRIPEEGHISIVGNVRKPGLYPMHSGDEATVLNAVAESEGLLPYASKRAYIYRFENAGEHKSEIPVELAKIMDRRSADIPLQAGDIFYIPDDHARRATLGTLEKILTAGSGAGAALVYAGVR